MKKLLSLIAAVAFVSTSSAQVLASYDFEDGSSDGWKVWQNKTNAVLGADKAKDSKHAYEVKVGSFFDMKGVKEGVTYDITADSKYLWGKDAPQVAIHFYNPDTKKLELLKTIKLPKDKDFAKFRGAFKAKKSAMHRVTFSCTPDAPCTFVLDNVKVAKSQGAPQGAPAIASFDFEDGTNTGWIVWQNQKNPMVEGAAAKSGKYSYQVKTGTSFDAKGVKEGETYVISGDTKYVWGKKAPQVSIQYYSSETKKLEVLKVSPLPMDKDYTRFEVEFTPKKSIGHRMVFSCTTGSQCTFNIDNIKVVKK